MCRISPNSPSWSVMISLLSGRNDHIKREIEHILTSLRSSARAARVDPRHHSASRSAEPWPTDRHLRVLHIVESYSAGVASALESYVDATDGDIRHEILGFRRSGSQIGPPPERFFCDLPSGKLRQALAVRAHLRTTDADIVHVHSSWAGLFVRASLRRLHRPVVFSPHCYASERSNLRSAMRWLYRWVESVLARRTDVVAAVGEHEQSVAAQISGSVPVMPLAHALSNNVARRLSVLSERRRSGVDVVATLARVAPQKGIDYFCDVVAATRLRAASNNDIAPRFVWIGGGDPKLTQQLVRAGVEVTGWLERGAAAEQLADADVYLHTAAWEAGWPLSLLEAAQLGRPTICRRVSSTASLPDGLLVDSADDMAQRLQLWGDSPEALSDARDAVGRFAASAMQPSEQRDAFLRLYRTALIVRRDRTRRASQRQSQILRPAASQYGARN
jgi:glycosyltransferase involved in cell wall biosynthesis